MKTCVTCELCRLATLSHPFSPLGGVFFLGHALEHTPARPIRRQHNTANTQDYDRIFRRGRLEAKSLIVQWLFFLDSLPLSLLCERSAVKPLQLDASNLTEPGRLTLMLASPRHHTHGDTYI